MHSKPLHYSKATSSYDFKVTSVRECFIAASMQLQVGKGIF